MDSARRAIEARQRARAPCELADRQAALGLFAGA
jgi:hypothetical protein